MIRLLAVDIAVVVLMSLAIGVIAPRVPDSWLRRDVGPLTLLPAESSLGYRSVGVSALIRRLPDWGETFGGTTKSSLPGTTPDDLIRYAVEVRRAEWVHWLSILVSVILFAFNPWWLAASFVVLVAAGNLPFILVLRNNRLRIRAILERSGGRR